GGTIGCRSIDRAIFTKPTEAIIAIIAPSLGIGWFTSNSAPAMARQRKARPKSTRRLVLGDRNTRLPRRGPLTVKLRGRPEAPDRAPQAVHGPLQRLLEDSEVGSFSVITCRVHEFSATHGRQRSRRSKIRGSESG